MVYLKSYLKSEDTEDPGTVLYYETKKFRLNESEHDLLESVRSEMEEQCIPRSKNNLNLTLNMEEYEEIDLQSERPGSELIKRIYKARGKSPTDESQASSVVLVFEITGPKEILANL